MKNVPPSRKPSTPGEILEKEFLEPYGMSQSELAERIHIPFQRVNLIVKGKRSVTTDTAIRFGKLFGTTPEFWLNIQQGLDLYEALHDIKLKTDLRIKPISREREKIPA
jgi:addiction module HigA family antidote